MGTRPSNPFRPSWHQVWEHIAMATAERSLCVRAKVGAAIVDPENRIVSVGYNNPPAGFEHQDQSCASWCPRADPPIVLDGGTRKEVLKDGYTDCVALHAEANALSVCDRTRRKGGTMYVTSPVCWTCAKLIANSGLAAVAVADDPTDRSYRNASRSYEFLESCGIEVITNDIEQRKTSE